MKKRLGGHQMVLKLLCGHQVSKREKKKKKNIMAVTFQVKKKDLVATKRPRNDLVPTKSPNRLGSCQVSKRKKTNQKTKNDLVATKSPSAKLIFLQKKKPYGL